MFSIDGHFARLENDYYREADRAAMLRDTWEREYDSAKAALCRNPTFVRHVLEDQFDCQDAICASIANCDDFEVGRLFREMVAAAAKSELDQIYTGIHQDAETPKGLAEHWDTQDFAARRRKASIQVPPAAQATSPTLQACAVFSSAESQP